ncbi:acyltransferase family protein [Methanosarcina sp. KYL-1]|uniref:acyltransferase family protein n=1 Tax=Methanosarcina sp. KYL-1 TaxID=2602068 RepID=UPI0021007B4F|nr:acyltransferase family protein [Methanosarcina sp. KYL-1]MCQ1535101.1 acyltransferase family protein [Methanosarcina sp. KYL-1]
MRYKWIDALKGFGIILVILGHLPTFPELHTYIYSFHIPLFFFISGYLFSKEKYTTAKKYVTSRIRGLIWPYFSFTLLSYIIFVMTSYSLSEHKFLLPYEGDIMKTFYSMLYASANSTHFELVIINQTLWFLPCLFITSMIFYLLFRFFGHSPKAFISATIVTSLIGYYLIKYLPRSLPWSADTALSAVTFYSGGYLFRNYFEEKFFNVGDFVVVNADLIFPFLAGFNFPLF